MKKIGIIGWRGMVGQVLMERMRQENDFKEASFYLFSTSMSGVKNTYYIEANDIIGDANSLEQLMAMDILVACQGGEYSLATAPALRKAGWNGYWVDAASAFRMKDDACLILDPLNLGKIETSIDSGIKDFVGANCTVSLMLLGLGGLFKENLVEWVSSMTYQAASGAGAQNMIELLKQSYALGNEYNSHPALSALEYEKSLRQFSQGDNFPKENFGFPLALNLLPWIDSEMPSGQSKEEWKAQVEANKILNNPIKIDGTCVRVGSLRSHAQGLTIKLKKNVAMNTIESLIQEHNEWVEVIPNDKKATLNKLTPAYTSGTLKIPIGRLRKMTMGDEYLNAFTVGDQLLWGAAEPLRRMVRILLKS